MDVGARVRRISAAGGGQKLTVECAFPQLYPNGAAPTFQILQTTLDAAMRSRVLKVS
jgi:hypothetical protein